MYTYVMTNDILKEKMYVPLDHNLDSATSNHTLWVFFSPEDQDS